MNIVFAFFCEGKKFNIGNETENYKIDIVFKVIVNLYEMSK